MKIESKFYRISAFFTEKSQTIKIFWILNFSRDFATETVEFFRKWISKRSKEVRKKLELEKDPF